MNKHDDILGNELTRTIEAMNAVVRRRVPADWATDVDLLFDLFGDFWALTLGRATEMAAGTVVGTHHRIDAVEQRVEQLEARQVGEGHGDG